MNSASINSASKNSVGTEVSLQEILAKACGELFDSYGIDVAAGTGSSQGCVIGRIHFAGQAMTGDLTIGLDRAQLQQSLPFKTETDAELEDWARELANQLMGLVKTELQLHGVKVLLSLPLTVRSSGQSERPLWPPNISQFNVSCNFANALSCLDGVMTAEVQLQKG